MKDINAEELLQSHKQLNDMFGTNPYEDEEILKLMKAYALHVLERVEKEAEKESYHSETRIIDGFLKVVDIDDLKQIFEEIKKELK